MSDRSFHFDPTPNFPALPIRSHGVPSSSSRLSRGLRLAGVGFVGSVVMIVNPGVIGYMEGLVEELGDDVRCCVGNSCTSNSEVLEVLKEKKKEAEGRFDELLIKYSLQLKDDERRVLQDNIMAVRNRKTKAPIHITLNQPESEGAQNFKKKWWNHIKTNDVLRMFFETENQFLEVIRDLRQKEEKGVCVGKILHPLLLSRPCFETGGVRYYCGVTPTVVIEDIPRHFMPFMEADVIEKLLTEPNGFIGSIQRPDCYISDGTATVRSQDSTNRSSTRAGNANSADGAGQAPRTTVTLHFTTEGAAKNAEKDLQEVFGSTCCKIRLIQSLTEGDQPRVSHGFRKYDMTIHDVTEQDEKVLLKAIGELKVSHAYESSKQELVLHIPNHATLQRVQDVLLSINADLRMTTERSECLECDTSSRKEWSAVMRTTSPGSLQAMDMRTALNAQNMSPRMSPIGIETFM